MSFASNNGTEEDKNANSVGEVESTKEEKKEDSIKVDEDGEDENGEDGEGEDGEGEPEPDIIDGDQLEREFQESARKYLAEQTAHVIIPSFAKWFDFNTVHAIEKKSFPDFFTDESVYKNPQSYKYIRDFLINTFRLNPREYLTITSVRRNLSGDVTNIIRVHQFLEKWGLINYQIDPKTKSSILGPQFTGHFQVTLDAPEGLIPYVPENASIAKSNQSKVFIGELELGGGGGGGGEEKEEEEKEEDVKQEKKNGVELDSIQLIPEIRRNVYAPAEKKIDFKLNNLVHYACSICGKDATEVRYHNLKIKSYSYNPNSSTNNVSVLCSICYEQGLFPSNFTSGDFVKLKKSENSQDWTEQEILLLLEGIEMFGAYEPTTTAATINASNINVNTNNQWNKISEHVATKTREQCLTKFLQLPIEDKFLSKLINDEPQTSSLKDRSALVEEIVKELVKTNEGKVVVEENAKENLSNSIIEQTSLINQVIELTIEKVNLKLERIDHLQSNLITLQNQLTKERKANLLERWAQYEKIQKLKQSRPDLSDVLSDLLKPVGINEIDRNEQVSDKEDNIELDKPNTTSQLRRGKEETDQLPVSYNEPKSYQFWSG
ncbi:RSC8 [Candida oxycetoniae]|uniref:RSC8 n=1 Tax=Candida oxycetoniae TaxID=497107 RepID=A0AAI9SVE9_9ASCO|nr:RSC8 [Candida oxycetoniae]KAI3403225.2 RSC8 [Candida oxycetoniae]